MSKPKSAPPKAVSTEPLLVPALFATRLRRGTEIVEAQDNLAAIITDVQIETQVVGANCLKLAISDPNLQLVTNGLFCATHSGTLPTIDLELDGVSYRLTDITGTTDLSQPNLTMEFQTLGAVLLRETYRNAHAKRGAHMTRAEFIKAQMHSVKGDAHVPFISPALEVIQPIGVEIQKVNAKARHEKKHKGISPSSQMAAHAGKSVTVFKESKGTIKNNTIGAPASLNTVVKNKHSQQAKNLTVKTAKISPQQEKVANELLDTAQKVGAGQVGHEAVVFAAIGESAMGADIGPTLGGGTLHYGVLQGNEEPQWNTVEQATKFFRGTTPFQGGGGALALEKGGMTDPIKIAETVESGGAYPNSENNLKEAQAIVVNYGGSSTGTSASKGGTTGTKSYEEAEFEIKEEEDFWTGLQKTAQEVDWLLWFEGNICYYMNSYELITAMPLCVIDVVENRMVTNAKVDPSTGQRTYDKNHHEEMGLVSNFMFDYGGTGNTGSSNHKSSTEGAVGGVSTECSIDIICSPNFICAGDVIMLTDPNGCGPWSTGQYNGRWVVINTTRSLFNTYTACTLAIPGTTSLPAPLDEPLGKEIINTNTESPAAASGSGDEAEKAGAAKAGGGNAKLRNKIVANAVYAARLEKEKSLYEYTESGSRNFKDMSLFNIEPPLTHIQLDCSGFCMMVYKECGAPDPNAPGYVGGNTYSMMQHGYKTSHPQPGDLAFVLNGAHVVIYIGNGKCVSMGHQGDPTIQDISVYSGLLGYWDFIDSAAVHENVHQAEVTTSQGGNPQAEQEAGEMRLGG